MVDILSKYREMTPTFKREVLDCTRELYICEEHYEAEDIILTSTNKKVLSDMALPTLKLYPRSHFQPFRLKENCLLLDPLLK